MLTVREVLDSTLNPADLVREAFAADKAHKWFSLIDEAFEFDAPNLQLPDFPKRVRGRAEAIEMWKAVFRTWPEYAIEIDGLTEVPPEQLLIDQVEHVGNEAGIRLDRRSATLITFQDGRIVRQWLSRSMEDLLEETEVGTASQHVVVRSLKASARGDWETAMEAIHPEIEYDLTHFPEGRVWHGHDGIREAFRIWLGAWEDYSQSWDEVIDTGDGSIVVVGSEGGRGKGSGAEMRQRVFALHTLRDGQAVSIRFFGSREDVLAAAGIA
jgi:ketosteroid isomerase-like protein